MQTNLKILPSTDSFPAVNGSATTAEALKRVCRECNMSFTIELTTIPALHAMALRYPPSRCAACNTQAEIRTARERAARDKKQELQRRAALWGAECPPQYADTDPARLPTAARQALEAWRHGTRGLGIVGPSGRCKTRAVMLLGKRLVCEEGRSFKYVPTTEFAHKISRLAGERMADLDAYVNRLCQVQVLFLDDLGKGRLTDRVEAELYHVIEQRTAHQRPILFTANASAAGLAEMLSSDRGEPIIRRLREFTEIVIV